MATIITFIYLISAWDSYGLGFDLKTDGNTFKIIFTVDDELKECLNPDLLPLIKEYSFETFLEAYDKFHELEEALNMEFKRYYEECEEYFE